MVLVAELALRARVEPQVPGTAQVALEAEGALPLGAATTLHAVVQPRVAAGLAPLRPPAAPARPDPGGKRRVALLPIPGEARVALPLFASADGGTCASLGLQLREAEAGVRSRPRHPEAFLPPAPPPAPRVRGLLGVPPVLGWPPQPGEGRASLRQQAGEAREV